MMTILLKVTSHARRHFSKPPHCSLLLCKSYQAFELKVWELTRCIVDNIKFHWCTAENKLCLPSAYRSASWMNSVMEIGLHLNLSLFLRVGCTLPPQMCHIKLPPVIFLSYKTTTEYNCRHLQAVHSGVKLPRFSSWMGSSTQSVLKSIGGI